MNEGFEDEQEDWNDFDLHVSWGGAKEHLLTKQTPFDSMLKEFGISPEEYKEATK